MTPIDRLREARAAVDWDGWDWTQDFSLEAATITGSCVSDIVTAAEAAVKDLRDRAEAYAADVEEAAERAADLGDDAVDAAEEGDWARALDLAEQACAIEQEYGDCPEWRPFRDLIEELIEEAEAAAEAYRTRQVGWDYSLDEHRLEVRCMEHGDKTGAPLFAGAEDERDFWYSHGGNPPPCSICGEVLDIVAAHSLTAPLPIQR